MKPFCASFKAFVLVWTLFLFSTGSVRAGDGPDFADWIEEASRREAFKFDSERGGEARSDAQAEVVKQMTLFLSTEGRRHHLRTVFARLKNHKALIDQRLEALALPAELIVIPVLESGYQNLESPHPNRSPAGLWMMVPQTAKSYGLKIDQEGDDRLRTDLSTEAALRHLRDLHERFHGNWGFALAAYNQGESRIRKIIRQNPHEDIWALIKERKIKNYFPRIEAMALLMEHPELYRH